MCTRMKPYNQNIEKSLSGKSSFKSSVCVVILCGPVSCNLILTTTNSKIRKYFFLFHCFLVSFHNPL